MKGNILIVDDDSGALKLLKDILTAEGHEVRPFNNGELALRSVIAEIPELILLDIRMPGMDGFEVCQKLKESELLKEIPVIFISAASDMEDKVRAFQAGGVDYITKPFQREEVIARVKTHVALGRSRQELKQIAEALRKSEASLKMAQAIAHLGHWEWDMQTGQLVCSEEACRILGVVPNDLPVNYETFLQTVHPDDRERVANQINQIREGDSFDIEYRIILPDGRARVVHGKGEVVCFRDSIQPKIIGTIQELPEHEQTKMLGVIQDITERKEMELKLEEEAHTDSLTGAATRRRFLEVAEQELARIRRYGSQLSVFMLDLDHFKSVNDKYGHHAGDLTLMKLVEVCRIVMREVDVIGRLGGEEFAILLPKTGRDKALEVAERLRQAIAATDIPLEKNQCLHFTTSIGVATLHADEPNIDMLLRRADQALYEAKNSGRNRVCVVA